MLKFLRNHGILGINARNLLYLRPYNPKKAVLLADDKVKTKHFLQARGIPVPKLLARINNEDELEHFDWKSLPDEFVIKPNTGYGGEGIMVIKDRKGPNFVKINGDTISIEELVTHIDSILSGKFSLSGTIDTAIIEQRLIAHPIFKNFTDCGLPDVRVVVHNLIPVMAMLRIPTKESEGKANVHVGGIGIGIDIAKGLTTHSVQYNKIIKEIPGFGSPRGVEIPYWDDIMHIASTIQRITNLGYLACDIVIDKNRGPVLLEINARAGLMVQLANLSPLRRRLQRIQGIKVSSPEKGVRIGQDLFGEKIVKEDSEGTLQKNVIGHRENIEILMSHGTKTVLARIRGDTEKSSFDKSLVDELKKAGGISEHKDENCKVRFILSGQKITTLAGIDDFSDKDYDVIIGRRDLKDFLIDPLKPSPSDEKEKNLPKIRKLDFHSIDKRICDIDRKIKFIYHLQPQNLEKEKYRFFQEEGRYNPQFVYPDINFDPEELKDRLQYIETDDSPLGQIYKHKKEEIVNKIALLQARGNGSVFTDISGKLFPIPDKELYESALSEKDTITYDKHKDSILNAEEAKSLFEDALEQYELDNWKVVIKDQMVADCSVNKKGSFFIRDKAKFSKNRIESLIRHEIETHILTTVNGAQQPYEIFSQGTADYLLTQEGMAVYNEEHFNSHGLKGERGIYSIIGIYHAKNTSFTGLYTLFKEYNFSPERAYQSTLKIKRGLTDTSLPGCFSKSSIYYIGYKKIKEFIDNGGDYKDLYMGKINIDKVELYKQIKELKEAKILPQFLQ